ncbi:shikimate dehydrogenase family protein [Psychroserpens luteolus]|uniref:shikimate dehydrogenase family protein n=1 Tax=Psychroserpens luteolus TaxID=2855840 RepID=UPI001E34A965|nr:shikimate dehydrogenase [Psychroserpens luteolus]MCD2258706.1 shikimate dehydrogenase [Psychroserpens luteolus]
MSRLGLLGRHISYSFSREYFSQKFETLQLAFTYENFDLEHISELPQLLKHNSNIKGLNVTIPYKEEVIPYLDALGKKAKKIGAVNTITINSKGKLKGYNTDCYGFKKTIKPFLKSHHKKALILGTGGASKAIAYTFKKLNIKYDYVSRSKKDGVKFTYDNLDLDTIKNYTIIINCTPIGTHPNVNSCPDIPYDGITAKHLLYDLIYNPEETKFLKAGKLQGAHTVNGYQMLVFQAEKAWKIWKSTF